MSKIILLCFVLFVSASLGEVENKAATPNCPSNYDLLKCGPLCPKLCGPSIITCKAVTCTLSPRCYCAKDGYALVKPGGACVKRSECPRPGK